MTEEYETYSDAYAPQRYGEYVEARPSTVSDSEKCALSVYRKHLPTGLEMCVFVSSDGKAEIVSETCCSEKDSYAVNLLPEYMKFSVSQKNYGVYR